MERRELRRAAWTAGGLNLLGLLCAVGGMRGGAPMVALDARLAFLSCAPLGWSLGWAIWFFAALALVWLFVTLVWERARAGRSWLAEAVGLAFVTLGAATDLCCDALQIVLIPELAAAALTGGDASAFLTLERGLWTGGVVCGCGLYCGGVLIVTCARWPSLPRLARACGLVTALAGAVWVAAELCAAREVLEPATGATVLAFVGWAGLLPSGAAAEA